MGVGFGSPRCCCHTAMNSCCKILLMETRSSTLSKQQERNPEQQLPSVVIVSVFSCWPAWSGRCTCPEK